MEIHSSIDSSEELMHYGRKGMKWYQNIFTKGKTGSGKKGKSDDDEDSDESKSKSSNSSSSGGKKSAKDMSEAELMSAIRHLQLEKQYRDLEAQQAAELNPPKVSKGKEFVSDFVNKAAVPALQEAGKSVLKDWLVKVGKEAMGLNEKQVEDAGAKLKKEVESLELQKRKTLVEDFYKDRQKKAEKQAAKEAEAAKSAKKAPEAKAEADENNRDSTSYYSEGAGKKKTNAGKTFAETYREKKAEAAAKATVEPDTRTAKEKYEQSTGPIYTVDFTSSERSSGQNFVSQFLLEDKSK